jgi:hypothetical protein
MKITDNKGFDPVVIADYKSRMKAGGKGFLWEESEENNDECAHFYFVGKYEGREVIYDAVLYTLRLQHQSELFEIAEHKAAKHFPQYKKITYKEDENGNLQPLDELEEEIGLFIAEVIMDLEEADEVKVREHVDLDTKLDFGIGLDAGLHVENISIRVIEKFIKDFNEDSLTIDPALYSFQTEDEEAI